MAPVRAKHVLGAVLLLLVGFTYVQYSCGPAVAPHEGMREVVPAGEVGALDANEKWASYAERVAKFKDVNELRAQLSIVREELYDLRRAKAAERRIAADAGIALPALDDSGPGPLTITAAAAYCNCPVLDNGSTAQQALARARAGVWNYAHNKHRRGKEGFVLLTSDASTRCPAEKRACSYAVAADNLPTMCPASQVRVSVDFRCGDRPERSVSVDVADVAGGASAATLVLDCTQPSPDKSVGMNVEGVRPVPYGNDFHIWPVSFTVPAHRVQGAISWKTKDFADTIPGNLKTYTQMRMEELRSPDKQPDLDYFLDYRRSYYCITRKKRGWDCLRHYEIIAEGCVPYFVDIDRLPANIMPHYPRELVKEAMELPGVVFDNSDRGNMFYKESYYIDHSIFNKTRYFELAAKIQAHARRYLRSDAMARYVLEALAAEGGAADPQRVLFVHHCYPDFMGDSLWSGFKELELRGELDVVHDYVTSPDQAVGGAHGLWGGLAKGENCVDGRKLSLMATADTLDKMAYYRHVNGWANHRSHNAPSGRGVTEAGIVENIRNKYYDTIVYANPSRTLGFVEEVKKVYQRSSVAMVYGDDNAHGRNLATQKDTGVVFVREMHGDTDGANAAGSCAAPGIAEAESFECCHMEEQFPIDNGLVWSTTRGDGKRWEKVAKDGKYFECSTSARYGHKIGDAWLHLDLHGKPTTLQCQHKIFGGPFDGPDPFPGFEKTCQCLKQ